MTVILLAIVMAVVFNWYAIKMEKARRLEHGCRSLTNDFKPLAFTLFVMIVMVTLAISVYFSRRVRTAGHYYVAGGGVRWFVNGFAIAGDYLSAASFLGITGLIAFAGYDGFIYAIGFLAGWIVALFLVAMPLRAIGKYTFADALTTKFKSRTVRLAARSARWWSRCSTSYRRWSVPAP